MIPPRTAKSPGSVTVGARLNPMRTRKALSASSSIRRPAVAAKVAPRSVSRDGASCMAAAAVVSSTKRVGIPWTSPARVAIRAAEMSARGDTRS